MSYPIKFLHLQKSELQYEVTIRGEIPASTVLELRRQVCKLTQIYPSDDIADSCLELIDDIKGISETLTKLKANLESLSLAFDENLIDRTRSLLNHLRHSDPRPYVKVNIENKKDINIYGLLDSGSVVSILGQDSYKILLKYGYSLFNDVKISVNAANGQRLQSLGNKCARGEEARGVLAAGAGSDAAFSPRRRAAQQTRTDAVTKHPCTDSSGVCHIFSVS
ncbi:hypothetical protein ACJJTC_002889 [Scirpophaga incertulas]